MQVFHIFKTISLNIQQTICTNMHVKSSSSSSFVKCDVVHEFFIVVSLCLSAIEFLNDDGDKLCHIWNMQLYKENLNKDVPYVYLWQNWISFDVVGQKRNSFELDALLSNQAYLCSVWWFLWENVFLKQKSINFWHFYV